MPALSWAAPLDRAVHRFAFRAFPAGVLAPPAMVDRDGGSSSNDTPRSRPSLDSADVAVHPRPFRPSLEAPSDRRSAAKSLTTPGPSPFAIKKEADDAKKKENRFKWNIAALQAVGQAAADEQAHGEEDEEGDGGEEGEEAPSGRTSLMEQKLQQLIGVGGRNAGGMKEHMLLRALTKRVEARTDEDLDMLQARGSSATGEGGA